MARRSRLTFADQLRREIKRCGISRYRVAKDSGVSESTISHFMNGRSGMTLANIDRIAALLDLRVVRGAQPRRKDKS